MNHLKMTVAGVGILMLTSCNGIFDDIYDQPKEIVPAKGQLLIDATSWTDWYYVDLNLLQRLTEAEDEEALMKAQTEFAAYPIPMTATGEKDESEAGHEAATQGRKAGQYMYWFDVFGEGIKKNTFSYYTPTEGQEEPEEWTLAVHRNNVRTNGGAVLETSCWMSSMLRIVPSRVQWTVFQPRWAAQYSAARRLRFRYSTSFSWTSFLLSSPW